jgi:hypothetical protein
MAKTTAWILALTLSALVPAACAQEPPETQPAPGRAGRQPGHMQARPQAPQAPGVSASGEARWDLRSGARAATLGGANSSQTQRTAEGARVQGAGENPPSLALDGGGVAVQPNSFLVVRMKAADGEFAGVVVTTDQPVEYTFPIRADGEMHTYNVWLGDYYLVPRFLEQVTARTDPVKTEFPARNGKLLLTKSKLQGPIRSLKVSPTYAAGGSGTIESIAIADRPSGPPLLVVEHVGPAEALSRVGRKAPWGIRIRNAGGEPARGISLAFGGASGLKVVSDSVRNVPSMIPPDETRTIYFDTEGSVADAWATLDVTARCDQGDTVTASGRGYISPAVQVEAGRVPPPKPIVTAYDIGAWYFPAWGWLTQWPSVVSWFERRPQLGYYNEEDPAVYDWEIKWAVEHGVNYFLVECIWTNGRCPPYLDGLLKAKFLPYIKYQLSYVNHEGAGLPGTGDQYERNFYEMMQTWIASYLGHPQYKRTSDGRAIVDIFNAPKFFEALGKDPAKVQRVLARVNDLAKTSGLPGISWTGGGIPANNGALFRQMGFEGTGVYNWPELGTAPYPVRDVRHYFAFGEETIWNRLYQTGLQVNLPIGTGYNHKGWKGGRTPQWVLTGMNEDAFEQHLRQAKSVLDQKGDKTLLIEAWNEWGEGSSLGPYAVTGFHLLKTLQKVFAPNETARPIIVPSDVGVYPQEIPDLWRWVDFTPALVPPGGGTPPASGQGIDIPPGSYPGQPAPSR